jgi:outer membrane protein TolC
MKFLNFFLIVSLILSLSAFSQSKPEMLNLDDCVQIALKNNPQLKISRNQLEIAEQEQKISYSNILPSVDVAARYSRFYQAPGIYAGGTQLPEEIPSSEGNNYSTSLDIFQNIFDGGYWWNNISKTKRDRAAQEYAFYAEKQRTIVSVQQAYITLVKDLKLLDVNQQAVQRSEEQLQKTQTQYELGAVAKVDVFQARTNLGNDKIALLTQENAVLRSRQNLNMVIGRDPQEIIEIKTDIKINFDIPSLDSLFQVALQNNPSLKQYEESYRSAKLGTKLATSNYWPQLGAYFSYSRRTPEFETALFKNFDKNYSWFAGINISWNIFRGFSDYRNRQKAKLNEKIALETSVDNRRTVMSQVKGLSDNLESYIKIIKINEENLESSGEQYRLAEERYRVGSGTQLEVREAQVNLTRAEEILVGAENNAIITYAQLLEAIGALVDAY